MAKIDISALSLQTEAKGRHFILSTQQNKHVIHVGIKGASGLHHDGTASPKGMAHLCNERPMTGWSSPSGACQI